MSILKAANPYDKLTATLCWWDTSLRWLACTLRQRQYFTKGSILTHAVISGYTLRMNCTWGFSRGRPGDWLRWRPYIQMVPCPSAKSHRRVIFIRSRGALSMESGFTSLFVSGCLASSACPFTTTVINSSRSRQWTEDEDQTSISTPWSSVFTKSKTTISPFKVQIEEESPAYWYPKWWNGGWGCACRSETKNQESTEGSG